MISATDTGLEQLPWTVVIDKSVNSVLPEGYRVSNFPDGLRTYIVGTAYAGALAKLERPIVPGCFKPSMTVQVMPDEATLFAQALEFDLRIQLGGLNYNFSAQINYAEGGMLQISKANGEWIDTGWVCGKLAANVWSTISLFYSFDTTKKTYSIVSVTVAGQSFQIPATLQNLSASPLAWQDGIAVIQVQVDLGPNGGGCSHKVKVSLGWN